MKNLSSISATFVQDNGQDIGGRPEDIHHSNGSGNSGWYSGYGVSLFYGRHLPCLSHLRSPPSIEA